MNINIPTLEALEAYVRGDELSTNDRSWLRTWILADPQIRDDIARNRSRASVLIIGPAFGPGAHAPYVVEFDPVALARRLQLLPPVSEHAKRHAARLARAALDPSDPDHAEAMAVLGLPANTMRKAL